MTERQVFWFSVLAACITAVAIVVTRAGAKRIAGAFAGASAAGVVGTIFMWMCEEAGLWHMAIRWEAWFLALLWMNCVLCAYVFLLTWRIERRYGGRGLGLALGIVVLFGPLRDSWYMAKFPEWGGYAPGLAPMVAISVGYALLLGTGHAVMQLVAGPAKKDELARLIRAKGGDPR